MHVQVFVSHEPCVVIPYDGGERYAMNTFNDDDTHVTYVGLTHPRRMR